MKRLATALVLIPVLAWLVLAAPQWALDAALALIGLLAFFEYDRIVAEHRIKPAGPVGMAAGIALLLAPPAAIVPEIVVVLGVLVGMILALRARELRDVLAAAAAFSLGLVYIFGSLRCALGLRALNVHWLMFALIVSWAGDTVALYAGRIWGRHKLSPNLSPAKSWEGAIGSLAAGTAAGAVYAHYALPSASLAIALAFAAVGNLAGQAGDLFESALKRGAGIKDSGSGLPGHGGWLDRIDANLFGVPVVYGLVQLLGSGS